MISWNNVKSDIKTKPLESLFPRLSLIDSIRILSHSSLPIVLFQGQTRKAINIHLESKNIELGGLLLGNIFSKDNAAENTFVVEIIKNIASKDFNSSSVSLTMDSSIWDLAREDVMDGLTIVGWYHSHPNLGAFFSNVDRKTQKEFFNMPYSIGLVIDPIRKEEEWFSGKESNSVSMVVNI